MAESVLRSTVSLLARQAKSTLQRPSNLVHSPHRSHATGNAVAQHAEPDQQPLWTPHTVPSASSSNLEPSSSRFRLHNLRAAPNAPTFSSFLTDTHSRQHNYLRISVTERCNLRCLYCMPEEGVPLSPAAHLLTTPEIVYLSSVFVSQGVNKIRLTGGEPTVRKDIVDLMKQIGQLRSAGLKELCLTTNGISLHRKLDAMIESGLTGVNLSLDTLDPFQFTIMTRRNGHEKVMKSIHRILEMNRLGAGIKLKINCVVMRGMNESEILPFVEMGREKDLEVRFIEYMPFDGNKWSKGKMMSFKEMLALIREKYPDIHRVQDHPNDTSKTYKVPGFAGRVGFITSMTHNFCGSCNRLRITGDGNLKVCLFGNAEVSLRDILRESNNGHPIDAEAMEAIKQLEMDRQEARASSMGTIGMSERDSRLLEVIGMAVKRKKAKHAGMGELENMKNRPMILIDLSFPTRISRMCTAPWPFSDSLRRQVSSPLATTMHALHQPSTHQQFRVFSQTHRRPSARRESPPIVATSQTPPSVPTASCPPPPSLTHLTPSGTAHMVSIAGKSSTSRSATATCAISFSVAATLPTLRSAALKKGDALAVARVAGIMAAKKTADLIPLAHPGIGITGVAVDVDLKEGEGFGGIEIRATVECEGKTGVEMEALTAATVAGLAVYDMCKGVDKGMIMQGIRVVEKKGGKTGGWRWDEGEGRVVRVEDC